MSKKDDFITKLFTEANIELKDSSSDTSKIEWDNVPLKDTPASELAYPDPDSNIQALLQKVSEIYMFTSEQLIASTTLVAKAMEPLHKNTNIAYDIPNKSIVIKVNSDRRDMGTYSYDIIKETLFPLFKQTIKKRIKSKLEVEFITNPEINLASSMSSRYDVTIIAKVIKFDDRDLELINTSSPF